MNFISFKVMLVVGFSLLCTEKGLADQDICMSQNFECSIISSSISRLTVHEPIEVKESSATTTEEGIKYFDISCSDCGPNKNLHIEAYLKCNGNSIENSSLFTKFGNANNQFVTTLVNDKSNEVLNSFYKFLTNVRLENGEYSHTFRCHSKI